MAGIMLPKNLTEDLRSFINTLSAAPEMYITVNSENIAKEDNAFTDWLQKPGVDPFAEVNDFITKAALTDVGSSDELAALIDCRNRFATLRTALSMPAEGDLTQEKLDAAKDTIDALLGEKDSVKGFADAINDFNKSTGYKYAGDPAVKTMLIMAHRVEKLADDIEKYAVDEYVNEFNDYTIDALNNHNGINDLNALYDGYRNEFTAEFPDKNFADIYTLVGEKQAEYDELSERFAQVNKDISTTEKGLDRLNLELSKEKDALTQLESDLEFNKTNTETAVSDNEKAKTDSVNDMIRAKLEKQISAEAEERSNSVNLLAAYKNEEIEKLNNKEEYAPVKNGLVSGIRIITASAELLNEANTLGKLSSAADVDAVLGGSFAEKFRNTYNDLHKQEMENYSKKSGFGKLFSRKLPTADEILKETAEKCLKNGQSFGSAIKDSIRDMRNTSKENINKLGKTIGKENLFAEYSKEYDKAPERAKLRLDNEIAAGKKNSADFDKKSKLETRVAEFTDKAIERLKNYKENVEKDIAAKKSQIENIGKTIRYTEHKLSDLMDKKSEIGMARAQADTELGDLNYYTRKTDTLYNDYADRIKNVRNFRARAFEARANDRAERFNRRLDGFMARLTDNAKKGHSDSKEYKALVNKLSDLKDGGCSVENINALQKAADAYVKAKGEAKIFSRSSFGENRFNFATEISNWCNDIRVSAQTDFPVHDREAAAMINDLRAGSIASKLRPLPIRPEMRLNAPEQARVENVDVQLNNAPANEADNNARQLDEAAPEMY